MISCPAAKQMRWVKPSITSESPSCTDSATASFIEQSLDAPIGSSGLQLLVERCARLAAHVVLLVELAHALVEHLQADLDLVLPDDQRRREADGALAAREQ